MSIFNKAWSYFTGKKTTLGALVLFVVYVLKGFESYLGVSVVNAETLEQVNQLAMTLTGVGLLDKARRAL